MVNTARNTAGLRTKRELASSSHADLYRKIYDYMPDLVQDRHRSCSGMEEKRPPGSLSGMVIGLYRGSQTKMLIQIAFAFLWYSELLGNKNSEWFVLSAC